MAKRIKRHTVRIEDLKAYCNKLLATDDTCTPDFRRGVAAVIQHVLLESGQYNGFNYVAWTDEGGCKAWREDGEPKDNTKYLGDQTRIRYY